MQHWRPLYSFLKESGPFSIAMQTVYSVSIRRLLSADCSSKVLGLLSLDTAYSNRQEDCQFSAFRKLDHVCHAQKTYFRGWLGPRPSLVWHFVRRAVSLTFYFLIINRTFYSYSILRYCRLEAICSTLMLNVWVGVYVCVGVSATVCLWVTF